MSVPASSRPFTGRQQTSLRLSVYERAAVFATASFTLVLAIYWLVGAIKGQEISVISVSRVHGTCPIPYAPVGAVCSAHFSTPRNTLLRECIVMSVASIALITQLVRSTFTASFFAGAGSAAIVSGLISWRIALPLDAATAFLLGAGLLRS